jgi:hypothetical protein
VPTPETEPTRQPPMPEVRQIEVRIAREERGITLPLQENDDLLVLQTLMADIHPNLPHCDPRCSQQQSLPIEDVFVEDNQARARSSKSSGAAY